MVRLFGIVLVLFIGTNTLVAQFVLNLAGTETGTAVDATFSGTDLLLNKNGKTQFGGNKKVNLGSFSFSNGSAVTLAGTQLSGISGTLTLWGNKKSSVSRVLLTLDDKVFRNESLSNLTFTASSSGIQFDNLQTYIGDGVGLNQKNPGTGNRTVTLDIYATAVPEPSTYAAIIGGLALTALWIRRNRKRQPN